jgi:hypothetical protein
VSLQFPWQWQAFWNFQASKPFIHMPYNISIKFHQIQITAKIQKSSDLGEIWFPSRLWCCELVSKLHRNVKHYEYMCRLLSKFSKWLKI